ncbi:hypothetical protein [Saccharomonospora sp. CUA-673]|uniref:pPIWI_RE_Y domain-containing protein n=1 Tax=Saccharomonospora sp. CUA-673 TaxID=1904969 RepID=UPI001300F656
MASSTRYSSRGSREDEAEIVLASIASGLVRMSRWKGVERQQRPYDGNLQHGLDRLAIACVCASVPAPVGVGDLVWEWCATKPVHEWPLTFPADADVDDELLLIDGRDLIPGWWSGCCESPMPDDGRRRTRRR